VAVKGKKVFFWCAVLVVVYLAYVVLSLTLLPGLDQLKDRKTNISINVKDWKGNYHQLILGPKNRYWTPSTSIPPEMKWAVIVAEDSNFYSHEGIDVKAIKNAIKHDLEKKSFAKGASTITQQVAKNVFLSREKTIKRKLMEVYLAMRMEQELTKGRILELYLNVIELGPMVYGIGHGSQYYFGKSPAALTTRECAFIAAMLPGPRIAYNPYKNLGKVLKRSEMILRLLHQKGVISDTELQVALTEAPNIGRLQKKVDESIKKEEAFGNRTGAVLPVQGESEVPAGESKPEEKKEGEGVASEPPANPSPPVKP
jgi:monofunctional biosynthetic peptidoglycan transglycosylase